jgi:hypothetical protein
MADPLADSRGELLVARFGRHLGQIGREHPGDSGRVEHDLALQAFAVTAEAAEHAPLARRVGHLRGARRRQRLGGRPIVSAQDDLGPDEDDERRQQQQGDQPAKADSGPTQRFPHWRTP